jgi:hypothetical protein
MSALADIPEIIGFFSYSREDDLGSRGALSALRDAIQNELSAQLGRSQTDFRVWQDKAAISLGTLWEKEIAQGINQSVFFIPIITPRALRSHHCAFEFESFLAREAELGRDDLVFPILYIPVPALEDEKTWRQDPILKIVGTRQYLDWRELRHHDPHSLEVRQRLERFCRGITNALHRQWVSPQERKQREAEEAQRRSEEEIRRKAAEVEAERRAQEENERRRREAEHARLAEQEARERAEEERRRRKAVAEKQTAEERAFKAAKAGNSVAAFDDFLRAHPESTFNGEANKLKADLQNREQAYKHAIASDDPVALKAFRDKYKAGKDVDEVRVRLRRLAPDKERATSKLIMATAGGAAIVLIAAAAVWFATRPVATNPHVATLAAPPSAQAPPSAPAAPAAVAASPHKPAAPAPISPESPPQPTASANSGMSTVPPKTEAPIPASASHPPPDPAAIAWLLLRDTNDPTALQRFASQFPDSPFRKEAEARMTALATQQAAWGLVKDTKDPEQLRRFIGQFPKSPNRSAAEERIAALTAAPPPVTAPDPRDLTRLLQFELTRVGCFAGKVTGKFDDDTKAAWHKFIKLTSRNMPDDVSQDAIDAVRGIDKRVCPLVCPRGQHAEGGDCVANERPPKRTVKHEPPPRPREPTAAAAAPAPRVYCQGRSSGVPVSNGSNNCGN